MMNEQGSRAEDRSVGKPGLSIHDHNDTATSRDEKEQEHQQRKETDLPVGNPGSSNVPGDGLTSRTEEEEQHRNFAEGTTRTKKRLRKQSGATHAEHPPDHIAFVRDFMFELRSTSAEIAQAMRQKKTKRILKRKTDKAERDVQRQHDSEQMVLVHELTAQQKVWSSTNAALRHENAHLERILKHARRLNSAEGSHLPLAEDHRAYQLLHEELLEVEAARMKLLLKQREAHNLNLASIGDIGNGEEDWKPRGMSDADGCNNDKSIRKRIG